MAVHNVAATIRFTDGPAAGGGAVAISQPAAVGSSGASGYTENCGGVWVTPPYQLISGAFAVALWADHQEGIDHVKFRVNGGTWVTVSEATKNSAYAPAAWIATIVAGFGVSSGGRWESDGKPLWVCELDAGDYADGQIVVQAVAYPVSGVPLIIGDLPLTANDAGTITPVVKYADSVNGNDTTGNGSSGNPYQTVGKAEIIVNGLDANHGIVYCKAGTYAYAGGSSRTNSTGWLTVSAAPGVSRANVTFTGYAYDQMPSCPLRKFKDVTFDDAPIASLTSGYKLWIDNCVFTGAATVDFTSFLYRTWVTNTHFHDMDDTVGMITDGNLTHNVVVDNILGDAFHGYWIINSWINDINPEVLPGIHSDILQYGTDPTSNVGMYGIGTSGTVRAQAMTNGNDITDAFYREVDFAAINIDNNLMIASDWRNAVFTNVRFGSANYLLVANASPFTATKVVFDSCTGGSYDPALNTIEGVTVR